MKRTKTTSFVKVRCTCKNEQIIYSNPSTKVTCLVCNEPLAVTTGGKANITARVLEMLE